MATRKIVKQFKCALDLLYRLVEIAADSDKSRHRVAALVDHAEFDGAAPFFRRRRRLRRFLVGSPIWKLCASCSAD